MYKVIAISPRGTSMFHSAHYTLTGAEQTARFCTSLHAYIAAGWRYEVC